MPTEIALSASEGDHLPTPEELELVGQLKARFAEEFATRAGEGRDFACLFGDIYLTRVLRGNDGELEKAVTWYTNFLRRVAEWDVDQMVVAMTVKMDEAGTPYGDASMLPHHEEIKDYYLSPFTAPKLAPNGDVINYAAIVDCDKEGLLERWDNWTTYYRHAVVLRLIELDRLSRSQGRIAKIIHVFDCASVSVTSISNKTYDKKWQEDVNVFMEEVVAEILNKIYVVNMSWLIVKLFNVAKRILPARVLPKIALFDSDGLEDPDFVQLMSGRAQIQQLLASRIGLSKGVSADATSGEHELAKGEVFEKAIAVSPGQRVSWNFEVARWGSDVLAGVSDIEFAVVGFWTDEEGDAVTGDVSEDVVPTARVAGEQNGSYEVTKSGILVLRWGNRHSWTRGKKIKFSVELALGPSLCCGGGARDPGPVPA